MPNQIPLLSQIEGLQQGQQGQGQFNQPQGGGEINPQLAQLFNTYLQQQSQPTGFEQRSQQGREELLGQLRTPTDVEGRRQRITERFEKETIPGIAAKFGGRFGSGLTQSVAQARGDLEQQLEGLFSQQEQHRQGALGQFLSGNEQLAQRQQEINQRGQLGAGQFGLDAFRTLRGSQQTDINQLINLLRSQVGAGSGQGDVIKDEGALGQLIPILQALAQIGVAGGKVAAGV